jgi:hypothetical protein
MLSFASEGLRVPFFAPVRVREPGMTKRLTLYARQRSITARCGAASLFATPSVPFQKFAVAPRA